MIERKSFTIAVPDGSNADYYIPDEISNIMYDVGIKEEDVKSIFDREHDGIYTVIIYYIKG